MTFREMIEQYKMGTLSDENRALLEAEIEKHEAISDYLFDEADISVPDISLPEGDEDEKQAKQFTAAINSSIRRAFAKSGIIIGSIILVIVLAVIFIVPQAVSSAYYDPTEVVATSEYGIETTRLDLELSVFTELFLPGKYRNKAIIDAEGYGEYNITIPQTTSITGAFTSVSGKLTRGELLLYDPNLFSYPTSNAFVIDEENYHIFSGTGAAGDAADAFAALSELDDRSYYTAYFTLQELTEYEEFYSWYSEKDIRSGALWCGVYTENYSPDHLGFCPELAGRCLDWNREKYPKLCLLDNNGSVEQYDADANSSEAMQTHFVSMLRYMKDHPDTADMLALNRLDWSSIIGYVENNGLDIFGFAVVADKENIMKIAEDSAVSYVYTTPFH